MFPRLLGDPLFKPIWDKLDALHAVVFIHPTGATMSVDLISRVVPMLKRHASEFQRGLPRLFPKPLSIFRNKPPARQSTSSSQALSKHTPTSSQFSRTPEELCHTSPSASVV
jgi:hypothetical protein